MRTAYAVIVPFGLVSVISMLCLYASPHWASLFLSLSTIGALLIFLVLSAVLGLGWWRRSSAYWPLPTIVCLAFLTIDSFMPAAGRHLADYQFKKHLSEYNEVVMEVKKTKIVQTAALVEVIRAKRLEYLLHNLRIISATRCEEDSIVVTFTQNTQVMLLHTGYLYRDGDSSRCKQGAPESKWPYLRPVIDNWYRFSDQPGL